MKVEEFKIEIHQFGKLPNPEEGIIYVARENGVDVGLSFICPCGVCNQRMWLPLGHGMEKGSDGPREIRWIIPDVILMVYPSIHYGGCNSHYHIRMNKVDWC